MNDLVLISDTSNMRIYDLLREENGNMYGYPVTFARDETGQWKITDF